MTNAVVKEKESIYMDGKVARIASLKALIQELRNAEKNRSIDASEFSEIFRKAVQILELTDEELNDLLQISRPTIWRWSNGESAPHPIGRPAVFSVLRDEAKNKLGFHR